MKYFVCFGRNQMLNPVKYKADGPFNNLEDAKDLLKTMAASEYSSPEMLDGVIVFIDATGMLGLAKENGEILDGRYFYLNQK